MFADNRQKLLATGDIAPASLQSFVDLRRYILITNKLTS